MRTVSSRAHAGLIRVPHHGSVDDALSLLTGREAGELLAAAVGSAGGEVVAWSPSGVHHRPGSSTTASYRAHVRWGGQVVEETLVACVGGAPTSAPPPGVVVLGDGVDQVQLWRFPADPELPGLSIATDPARLAGVLADLGVPGFSPSGGPVGLQVRTYRPCRRAVIEVRGTDAAVFVRVMRPDAVEALRSRHALLHDAGVPVPRPWGATPQGLLVIEAIPGPTLRHHLRTAGPAPSGDQLLGLLDRLPAEVMDLPVRRAWADEARHYASIIGSSLPAEESRTADLAEVIMTGLAGLAPDAPTHGDFHDDQVVMSGSSIRSLLDVDTAGPGRRADDVATMLGHLEASVLLGAAHPDRLRGLVRDWQSAAESLLDARELRLRVAGVLMSLATGPFRTQQQGWQQATTLHVDAVERWVLHAQQLRP